MSLKFVFQSMLDLLLVFHFSLVFSITLLCGILYLKARDAQIARFLHVLCPFFILTLVYFLRYYFHPDRGYSFSLSSVSFYLVVFVCILLVLCIRGILRYVASLLAEGPTLRKKAFTIINYCVAVLLLLCLFFLFSWYRNVWTDALLAALTDLFLLTTALLVVPTVVASFYLPTFKGKPYYRLLSEIMIAFYPLILFVPIDLFFLSHSPFKLSFLSYSLFILFVYLYISRHYIHRYEPEKNKFATLLPSFAEKNDISKRELDVITLMVEGKSNGDIAHSLFISTNTVKTHVRNIYRKINISTRGQLLFRVAQEEQHSPSWGE